MSPARGDVDGRGLDVGAGGRELRRTLAVRVLAPVGGCATEQRRQIGPARTVRLADKEGSAGLGPGQ